MYRQEVSKMIKSEYFGKKIKLIDEDGKEWIGVVRDITPAADSESGENEIAIEYAGGLTNFTESEIESIEIAEN